MLFDRPEHKELCFNMIQATNFPGQILELVLEFKQAVKNADVLPAGLPGDPEQSSHDL